MSIHLSVYLTRVVIAISSVKNYASLSLLPNCPLNPKHNIFFPSSFHHSISPSPSLRPPPLSPHHKSPFVGNSSSSPPGNYRSRDFSSAPLRATEALPYRPSGGGRHNDYFAVRKIDVAVLHFPVFFYSLFLIC